MSGPQPPDEVLAFYALGLEAERLELDHNRLERPRTQELILRERLLAFLRTVETEPSLLGVSPHLLAIARRPAAAPE